MESNKYVELQEKYKQYLQSCLDLSPLNGWYELIDELLRLIDNHLIHDPKLKEIFRIIQVKSKFGGVRIYVDNSDEYIDGIIDMAESMSFHICEGCGNKGSGININGWYTTCCKDCESRYRKGER